ncbi:hypothetical protein MTBBW1_1890009 [Desulfamplus magnetovallimortis]|uniref:Uncharacterized protein n=1 Tax=Desulfamplus magnetovallimortis TaxID=1246637 RepID=A0A1W1HAU2_9BACT|nr:hypothetical protein MTBBW1_1890009 [Desulfamplus magnetovallimortis]
MAGFLPLLTTKTKIYFHGKILHEKDENNMTYRYRVIEKVAWRAKLHVILYVFMHHQPIPTSLHMISGELNKKVILQIQI